MRSFIHEKIQDAVRIKTELLANAEFMDSMTQLCERAVAVYRNNRKIIIAGNGGSAADAQHIACELVGRFGFDRPALPALSLATDTSILTALGNDYGYEYTFARQVEALGVEGDMFIGISTSGNSPNIGKALKAARNKGLITVGLTGRDGGKMNALCDLVLRVNAVETPRIQEVHIMLGHILCAAIENAIFA